MRLLLVALAAALAVTCAALVPSLRGGDSARCTAYAPLKSVDCSVAAAAAVLDEIVECVKALPPERRSKGFSECLDPKRSDS